MEETSIRDESYVIYERSIQCAFHVFGTYQLIRNFVRLFLPLKGVPNLLILQ